MKILAIDPGPTSSAFVMMENGRVTKFGTPSNSTLHRALIDRCGEYGDLVIEKIESFGMAVGAETFETVYWSGIFAAAYGLLYTHRIGRKAIKLHLCGDSRAKDGNIRQAIIDKYGGNSKAIGSIKCKRCKGRKLVGLGKARGSCPECSGSGWEYPPGPLTGIASHLWAALAVAVTFAETHGPAVAVPASIPGGSNVAQLPL